MKDILDKLNVTNYNINDSGLVDVNGDVDLSNLDLSEIPVPFGEVTGSFHCDNNKLIDLKNIPIKVGGDFWYHNNPIENPREQSRDTSLRDRVRGSIAYTLNLEEWWNEKSEKKGE